MQHFDVVVVGGGIVGSSIAFGIAQAGQTVAVLDEGDTAIRSARVNFGLIWVQSKGDGMPAYGRWTRRSADEWPGFAAELNEMTGVSTEHRKPGGFVFCFSEEELETRRQTIQRMHNQAPVYETEIIDRATLQKMIPDFPLGPDVAGASFCPHDGDANPLRLLQALHKSFQRIGVSYHPQAPAISIAPVKGGGFQIETAEGPFGCGKVVLAAGHGTAKFAPGLGLSVPIRPERGQIVVTERLPPFFPYPASGFRQTADGTVMLGATKEDVGMDNSATVSNGVYLASQALRLAPFMAKAKMVRTWAGLRVMTPDSHPVYVHSEQYPGAFAATCHSGVTLAGVHASTLAKFIAAGALPEELSPFHPRRFDVPHAA